MKFVLWNDVTEPGATVSLMKTIGLAVADPAAVIVTPFADTLEFPENKLRQGEVVVC